MIMAEIIGVRKDLMRLANPSSNIKIMDNSMNTVFIYKIITLPTNLEIMMKYKPASLMIMAVLNKR